MKFTLFILAIILWLVSDFWLGRKQHLFKVKREKSPIFFGNFDIFPHGQKLFADYFHELKNARKHIHVLFYILKDDAISHEFINLLKEKASEGVEVRLLLDRLGSYKVNKQMIAALKEAGVQFAFSNRIRFPYLFYSAQIRNHRKITIIDGTIGYLGGFNIGKEYIDLDPKLSPWRDYHLKITGESVSFLQKIFIQDWLEYAEETLPEQKSYYPQQPTGILKHYILPTEGFYLEESFLGLIQKARKSIIIGTPYFIPSKMAFQELLNAAKRGISITVVVPYTADHFLVQEASFHYLRKLIKVGGKVFQFKNGFYHAKTIIVDDDMCDIGTANFDKRSIFLNKEINCYILDADFTRRLKEIIQKDIQDSEPLTIETLTKPHLMRSAKEVIAGMISFFL